MKNKEIHYRHVDVFSCTPLSGNGLTVFMNSENLSTAAMQKITQEMRQYESIFLIPKADPHRFVARIFTMEEELDFAGHPILGAACALHEKIGPEDPIREWIFELPLKSVATNTIRREASYLATMEQGQPIFREALDHRDHIPLIRALNLSEEDIYEHLPLQVVSTGLPYLIVPIRNHLERVRINTPDFEKMLTDIGAKFCYIIDIPQREGRTWDNGGRNEDIATGSAAGPVGAYLVKHGVVPISEEIILHQGRFVGRPSQLFVQIAGTQDNITSVKVSGDVCMVARGVFDPLCFAPPFDDIRRH